MRIQENLKKAVCCFMVCVAGSLFFSMSNQAEAQVTYTVTGVFDSPFGGPGPVASGDSFTAVFEIDDSVVDSNPSDSNRGEYPGAIVSSSFSFSGGFTSAVDFSGGDVTVLPDSGGGGIVITSPTCDGKIVIFSSAMLASDALLTSAQDITGDTPQSLWSLTEPDGAVLTSFSGVNLGQPMVLSITTAQAPLIGDVDLSGTVDFLDINPFIGVLSRGEFQAEANCNQDEVVDFLDVGPFVSIIMGR